MGPALIVITASLLIHVPFLTIARYMLAIARASR